MRLVVGGAGRRVQAAKKEPLRTHQQAFSSRFENVMCQLRYNLNSINVNVFERGVTLPGRSDGSLAAAMPYRLQL